MKKNKNINNIIEILIQDFKVILNLIQVELEEIDFYFSEGRLDLARKRLESLINKMEEFKKI